MTTLTIEITVDTDNLQEIAEGVANRQLTNTEILKLIQSVQEVFQEQVLDEAEDFIITNIGSLDLN